MHSLPVLITDLTLISIYAGITILLFKWLKQPVVLGYILAGIVAGPYLTLFPSVTDKANITIWADIGVIFLLFSLGLEFSFKKIVNVGKTAIITAMTNIIFMLFAGYTTGRMIGWSTTDSLFLGGMISMSSTTIIIKAFEELNLKRLKFTDLVFGILVVEDLVGILLLVLLPTVALSNSVNALEMLNSTVKLIFFLILCFIVGVYLVPTFLKKVSAYIKNGYDSCPFNSAGGKLLSKSLCRMLSILFYATEVFLWLEISVSGYPFVLFTNRELCCKDFYRQYGGMPF